MTARPANWQSMTWSGLGGMALALAVGTAGALLFDWLTTPLPWMLGSMCLVTVGALLKLPLKSPQPIRAPFAMVLGVMLGSSFHPEILALAGRWTASLGLLIAYITVAALVVYPYFRRIAGYDPLTSYFCAMPGGLNEMIMVGAQMGADERRIALAHATRVLLVVFMVPLWFRLFEAVDITDRTRFGISLLDSAPLDLAILLGCGLVGWPMAKLLRFPTPALLGPMAVSALVHGIGLTTAPPPREIVNVAQLVLGTAVGSRFLGIPPVQVLGAIKVGLGATVLMLGITAGFAFAVPLLTGSPVASVVLAYSPGGLAEMSLVALALGVDVAFVSVHHIFRIMVVIVGAPLAVKLLPAARKRRQGD